MPLFTYTNLGLRDLAHTRLTVELADRTIKHPKGIAENVLVRIGKFVFPIDFIILDIPEDDDVSLILGRPFLSTAHAKIDERANLDSKSKLIGGAVDKSFDPHYGDYIKLNDLDMPLEPRMNQCFTIINDMDENVTSGVVLGMPFCKKFVSCQKIMEKFARGDECEQIKEE
ncbi:RNA-directed DNA polymerase, eukaryota [Tanacetum coccineum]